MTTCNPFIEKSSSGIPSGGYRYTYVLNNPLKYTDPSGYNYREYMQDKYGEGGFYFRGNAPGEWGDSPISGGNGGGAVITNWTGMSSGWTGDYFKDPTGKDRKKYYDLHTGQYYYRDSKPYIGNKSIEVPVTDENGNVIATQHWKDFGVIGFKNYIDQTEEENENIKSPIPLIGSITGGVAETASMAAKEVINVGKPVKVISKAGSTLGWVGEGVSIGISVMNFANNSSPGNLARINSSVGIAGLNITPVGPMGSFVASIIETAGGLNWYYNGLDKIYESTGLYIVPPGLYFFPVIIPTGRK